MTTIPCSHQLWTGFAQNTDQNQQLWQVFTNSTKVSLTISDNRKTQKTDSGVRKKRKNRRKRSETGNESKPVLIPTVPVPAEPVSPTVIATQPDEVENLKAINKSLFQQLLGMNLIIVRDRLCYKVYNIICLGQ